MLSSAPDRLSAARIRLRHPGTRCADCGSYRLVGGTCEHCGWIDPDYEAQAEAERRVRAEFRYLDVHEAGGSSVTAPGGSGTVLTGAAVSSGGGLLAVLGEPSIFFGRFTYGRSAPQYASTRTLDGRVSLTGVPCSRVRATELNVFESPGVMGSSVVMSISMSNSFGPRDPSHHFGRRRCQRPGGWPMMRAVSDRSLL